MKKMCFVKAGSDEWLFMWRSFKPDYAEEHPLSGEIWQYMGSVCEDGSWEHTFRHRMHPITGKREYKKISASAGFMARDHKVF